MKHARIFISGFVQGVGYRYFLRTEAKKLGITGWVRNLSEGRVEALLQGSQENIEKLITSCWNGPFLAEVKHITVEWENSTKVYQDFEIRPSP